MGIFEFMIWAEQSETNSKLSNLEAELQSYKKDAQDEKSQKKYNTLSQDIIKLYDLLAQESYIEEGFKKSLRDSIYQEFQNKYRIREMVVVPSYRETIKDIVLTLLFSALVYWSMLPTASYFFAVLFGFFALLFGLSIKTDIKRYNQAKMTRVKNLETLENTKTLSRNLGKRFFYLTPFGMYMKSRVDRELESIIVKTNRYDILLNVYRNLNFNEDNLKPMLTFEYDISFVLRMKQEYFDAFKENQ